MSEIWKRAAGLLCVKSLVTLILTAAFAALAVEGRVSQEFMTIYTVVVSFYFGTQHERLQGEKGGGTGG